MPESARSTSLGRGRPTAALRLALIVVAAAGVTGCAQAGLPFGALDRTATGSVAGTGAASASSMPAAHVTDPSDWEAVRLSLATALADPAGTAATEWSNPSTGSSGTISPLLVTRVADGRTCRFFTTTMNDLSGVRSYRGEACLAPGGAWSLVGITPFDASLS